ncbi:Cna B-type domain-containing protein [Bacillus arachidis]|uniref:Cna B-type domain-containing protein n=1 Tax=Bacillus arachidis TaxID=2819290 RepID=UPI00255CE41A|nr:Cna B-type domain-containing protein [Bacillus arachidis]WIY59345.1 Cna B-type domain-containing protein [Bacillus arachidis]
MLQNEKELKTQEVKADQTGNWNFNFKDLPKYDEQGNEYTYTVGEVKVDGYETKVEGTTITNTYKNTETTEVSGKKYGMTTTISLVNAQKASRFNYFKMVQSSKTKK